MANAPSKTNEILTTYVSDVHALVSHGLEAIERQVEHLKNVSHQDAKVAVRDFQSILASQKSALESRIKDLGGSPTQPIKDVVSAVAGVAAGIIDKVRPSATAKSIRDDHTFFSHLGVSWLMLYTTASSLGDAQTTSLSDRGYTDTTKAIMEINRILPKIVVEELREDKELHPADTNMQTRSMVTKAWSAQPPATA